MITAWPTIILRSVLGGSMRGRVASDVPRSPAADTWGAAPAALDSGASLRQIFEEPHHSAPSDPRARVPTRDTPPGFTTALRVTTLVALTGSSLAPAVTVADLASQLAPEGQKAIWFGVAGATTVVLSWRLLSWILKRAVL